jgi:hypothetical protein
VRQILADTETEQGHIEPQRQIPEVAERDRCRGTENLKKRMGDRYWETQRQSRATLPDTGSRREREMQRHREPEECMGDRYCKRQRQMQGHPETEKRM